MPDEAVNACVNCGEELHEVFEGSASRKQFVDALDIKVFFGHGEFMDHEPNEQYFERAQWCRGCALQLVAQFPGFRRMLRIKSFMVNYTSMNGPSNTDPFDDPNCVAGLS